MVWKCSSVWIYYAMPLDRGSQNILDFTDQTLYESVSKKKFVTVSHKIQSSRKRKKKNVFTLGPSDTWRLFISGKDTSKLDVPMLKWWGSAEVVSHDVESESIWFASSDGERFIICLKDNKSTKELSIQLPYHMLLLWTCKADSVLKCNDSGSLSLYIDTTLSIFLS